MINHIRKQAIREAEKNDWQVFCIKNIKDMPYLKTVLAKKEGTQNFLTSYYNIETNGFVNSRYDMNMDKAFKEYDKEA